jgi:hypothetical protein
MGPGGWDAAGLNGARRELVIRHVAKISRDSPQPPGTQRHHVQPRSRMMGVAPTAIPAIVTPPILHRTAEIAGEISRSRPAWLTSATSRSVASMLCPYTQRNTSSRPRSFKHAAIQRDPRKCFTSGRRRIWHQMKPVPHETPTHSRLPWTCEHTAGISIRLRYCLCHRPAGGGPQFAPSFALTARRPRTCRTRNGDHDHRPRR